MSQESSEGSINGVRLPQIPNTRVQRAIPRPFQRPSIVAYTNDGQRRMWKYVRVCDLQNGDIVVDVGLISQFKESFNHGIWLVSFLGGDGEQHVFPGAHQVRAFVVVSDSV